MSIALLMALLPVPVRALSSWGDPTYGDPPGWCTNFSDMWTTTVITNDPLVAGNPERDTFYGFHANPGYDDWYGYFYGDFRGAPGDSSGWVKLLHETYPHHYHWNFGDFGWAVHGHVKQYIAYYNWTFGGQCRLGRRGTASPPPYMADQYGYPIVDIYVDSVPPDSPRPYASAITPTSVSFTWNPVADRGDGAGRDYFVSGLDHYVSWVTLAGRPGRLQNAVTRQPRIVDVAGLAQGEMACLHVIAVDGVQNATPEQQVCASALAPPPMPAWQVTSGVMANPSPAGLVGLESWFWLSPRPSTITVDEWIGPTHYVVTATPVRAAWDFGDGSTANLSGTAGLGVAYPGRSTVSHVFEAHSQGGYRVGAKVGYAVSWTELAGGRAFGPYPLGSIGIDAGPLDYPVRQAQPELLDV